MADIIAKNDIESKDELLEMIRPKIKKIRTGQVAKGTIISNTRDEAIVDLGYKTEGVISVGEFLHKKHFDEGDIKIGESIEAVVTRLSDKSGRVLLSVRQAKEREIWENIEKIKENDTTVSVKVVKSVNGGLTVDFGGVFAFMPFSLVDLRRGQTTNYDELIGKDVDVKVLDIKRSAKNIVVSRKDVLDEANKKNRELVLKELEVGQIRKGVVSALTDFGAFIDLGGIDGLVHLSEISWNIINKPSDILEIGEEVTVQVTELQPEKTRVSLSIKATQPDPWQGFAETHSIGQIVKGNIRKITSYGTYISTTEYIEGFIRFNELFEKRVENISEILPEGSEVFVKITDLDLIRHKISLSVRRATESVNLDSDDFDPEIYGMKTEHNEDGSYKYPDGFDPKTGAWKKGFEKEKKVWEKEYKKATKLFNEHKVFIEQLNEKIQLNIKKK